MTANLWNPSSSFNPSVPQSRQACKPANTSASLPAPNQPGVLQKGSHGQGPAYISNPLQPCRNTARVWAYLGFHLLSRAWGKGEKDEAAAA